MHNIFTGKIKRIIKDSRHLIESLHIYIGTSAGGMCKTELLKLPCKIINFDDMIGVVT